MSSSASPPELRTGRLLLRGWRDSDREPFARLNADPEVMEHFVAPLTRAESDAFVDRTLRRWEEHGFGLWAVEVPETAPFIGFVGLAYHDFPAHFTPCVEVGWRLAREHWGRGYATEAALASLRFGFEELALPEIVSMTYRDNLRSRAVMERIGMTRDEADDFEHPNVPPGHRVRPHVLYRIQRRE
ncbi:MAG TPA: GNAT family N-acetyltransferase [Thermoleophilia bacterium]|nr:GNAT family N-acetyltransferase [Thermoleophilia bacterium]